MTSPYTLPPELEAYDHELDDTYPGQAELDDYLSSLPLDWQQQARAIVEWIRNLEADRLGLKAEIDRLWGKDATAGRKIALLRTWLLLQLQTRQLKAVDVGIAKPTRQKGSTSIRVDPLLIPQWPDDIRLRCTTTEVSVNKTELKKRYPDQLTTLPGVHLIEGAERLVLR